MKNKHIAPLIGAFLALGPITSTATQSITSYFDAGSPRGIAVHEAKRAGICPRLVLAILEHESRNCSLPTTSKTDLGCMQISRATARALKLDQARLVHDHAYNIRQGVAILAYFKARYEPLEPHSWWARYNVGVGTINGKREASRRRYLKRVSYQAPQTGNKRIKTARH